MTPNINKKITVVHANKYALFRKGISMAFEKTEDIELIGEAETGKQLLELLTRKQPDIVLMDIPLPEIDAFGLIPLIKEKYPNVKIVILTMYSDSSMILKIMDLGANAYLTSDLGSEDICESIVKCDKNGFYVTNLLKKAFGIVSSPGPAGYNEKEILLLKLLSENLAMEQLSERLDLSPRTILAIIEKLKKKTGSGSVEEMVKVAKEKGVDLK